MKRAIALLTLALSGVAALPASANDIVIYKSSATLPFGQYVCTRPGSAAPIPQTALIGSFVETQYFIFDQTAHKLQTIYYTSYKDRGVTIKYYATNAAMDVSEAGAGTRAERVIKSNLANTYFRCLSFGGYGEDDQSDFSGDGEPDYSYYTNEYNLVGSAKPFVVSTGVGGITLQKVATTLTGQSLYSYRDEVLNPAGPIHVVTLYFEGGAQTLTLDAVNTKKANTGANLVSLDGSTTFTKQTLGYGVRLAQKALEALGYDSSDDIPFESAP